MDVPLKLTLEVRIFCTSIGVLYIALGIVRCYSLYLQTKIRRYYIHVISGEYAHPDSASPPAYQPVNESKSSNQLRKDGQTQTNAIISGFGCIYGNMDPEELLAKLCEEKPPAESQVEQEQA
uniref:Uncharacterized protein n=1 Tax=Acrobeloides nanus TaxID=290746 RepID=A0A914CPT1_9BILA